ncbi:MAG: DUF6789 family protein [Burkholderiales bacterium]
MQDPKRTTSKRWHERLPKGILAGLTATIVLSLLMGLNVMMGLMPKLDLPKILAGMMDSPDMPIIGWIAHFMIGIVVYGIAIAVLDSKLPGTSHVGHRVMLGVIGWLIMIMALMPSTTSAPPSSIGRRRQARRTSSRRSGSPTASALQHG